MIYKQIHLGTLVLALHSYSGDKNLNMEFFQITCLKESKKMVVEENLKIKINIYKKLSHGIKNTYQNKLYQ